MSTHFNFCYLDLEKERNPLDDDGMFYNFEMRPSYEELNNPVLFHTRNNYFINECFSETILKGDKELTFIKNLQFVFGNMFWKENFRPANEGLTFFLNAWNLEWQKIPQYEDLYVLDFYAIYAKDISRVIERLNRNELEEYFNYAAELLQLNQERDHTNRETICEWIKMYELALEKNKGVVYDIG